MLLNADCGALHGCYLAYLLCGRNFSSHLMLWPYCGLIVRGPLAFPALKLLLNHQNVFTIIEINLTLKKLAEEMLGQFGEHITPLF